MTKCTVCKDCYITRDEEILAMDTPEKTVEAMKRFAAHGFNTARVTQETITLLRKEE